MTHDQVTDVENIIRQARRGQAAAIDKKESRIVDNFEQIIAYAECLLPVDNRFRRDVNV